MSQVMPDTGAVSTDEDALPELYHQPARAMLAHKDNPTLIKDVRVMFIAAPGFYNWVRIALSGQLQKIDFDNSRTPTKQTGENRLRFMSGSFEYKKW
jgi:hypothetical protein